MSALLRKRPSSEVGRSGSGGRSFTSGDGFPWGVGVPIILVMALCVAASIWFGWKIDKGLGELSLKQQYFSIETEMNRELTVRSASLSAKTSITRKAAVLGLFPPTAEQIRKP